LASGPVKQTPALFASHLGNVAWIPTTGNFSIEELWGVRNNSFLLPSSPDGAGRVTGLFVCLRVPDRFEQIFLALVFVDHDRLFSPLERIARQQL
jgi:hypothetical protein